MVEENKTPPPLFQSAPRLEAISGRTGFISLFSVILIFAHIDNFALPFNLSYIQ